MGPGSTTLSRVKQAGSLEKGMDPLPIPDRWTGLRSQGRQAAGYPSGRLNFSAIITPELVPIMEAPAASMERSAPGVFIPPEAFT